MNESKPLLFIETVKTETRGQYQTVYDSRDSREDKDSINTLRSGQDIDPTILRKIELLINRANDDQPVLCNVVTNQAQYKGFVVDSDEQSVYVKDENEEISKVTISSIKEIRILRIDY